MSDTNDLDKENDDDTIYSYDYVSDEDNNHYKKEHITNEYDCEDYYEFAKNLTKSMSSDEDNKLSEKLPVMSMCTEIDDNNFRLIVNICLGDGYPIGGFIITKNKLGMFSQIRTHTSVHIFSDKIIQNILSVFYDDFEIFTGHESTIDQKKTVLNEAFNTIPENIINTFINEKNHEYSRTKLCEFMYGLFGLISYINFMTTA